MSVRKSFAVVAFVMLAVLALPSRASADWLLTPFVGWNFGGSADIVSFEGDFDDEFEQRVNFGASLGWMGAGVMGFEADLSFTPNFFEDTRGPGDFEFGEGNVTTLMGNLILGIPVGGQSGVGFRPYLVGGAGLMRASADDPDDFFDVDSNSFGVNVGGGAIFFFNDGFGLRGDVRYFRSLNDTDSGDDVDFDFGGLRFWRGSVGATFRF